jgi:DNA-binding transcriptional LysR family regulator
MSRAHKRGNLNDVLAFLAVARERSFTKAAAKLGVSQSALSHTVRELEARLGVRLLSRTTRSVSATEAGERLVGTVGPRFEEIEAELLAASELREKPAGTIRITATDYAADSILWPKLVKFLREYPDIKVEINVDYGLTDIVAERYDAGVRSGEQVARDMIAVRIGPDQRVAVVGAPSYFSKRPIPKRPQELIGHDCIGLRLATHGGLYTWEFEKGGREVNVRVEGQLVFNRPAQGAERGAGRIRPGLRARGPRAAPSHPGSPPARARRLVPAILGSSPLLPEPTAVLGGLHAVGRRLTPPGLVAEREQHVVALDLEREPAQVLADDPAERAAARDVEAAAVQRTLELGAAEQALREARVGVRAHVVDGEQFSVDVAEGDLDPVEDNPARLAGAELRRARDPAPVHFARGRASSAWRGQLTRWSFTRPTACM